MHLRRRTNRVLHELSHIEWNSIIKALDTVHESFFSEIYDKYFPKVKIKIKTKILKSLWKKVK